MEHNACCVKHWHLLLELQGAFTEIYAFAVFVKCNLQNIWCAAAHFQFQQSRSNHLVRKELQQHLYQHQQQLHGYIDYVQRHSHQLLTLVVDNPSQDPNAAEMSVSAKEFDRLGLLLRPADNHNSDQGSPMEISPSPFTGRSQPLQTSSTANATTAMHGLTHCPCCKKSSTPFNTAAGSISLSPSAGMMRWQSHFVVLVSTCDAEDALAPSFCCFSEYLWCRGCWASEHASASAEWG